MEGNYQINLADCVVGPEELDLLLKEWQKDPKPKTVNEIARSYLTHRIKAERGFLPYNCRRQYKEKDRIIVRIRTTTGVCLEVAEVVRVGKNGYYNSQDGGRGDTIDIRLLSQDAKLKGKEVKTFVANYQGESINATVRAFEVIREKDETEVIPKILAAISSDDRFVAFEEKWLPKELLVRDVSYKLSDIEKVIAKCKQALSTSEILEKVQTDDNKEELGNRLEFSLNYFLSKNREFVQVPDSITKWDLRKPPVPVSPTDKRESTVTIKAEWLEECILIVPRKLSRYMEETNTVHILYDQVDEVLPYEENDRRIEGLNTFYSVKAIAEGDRVHLRLQALEPTQLFIHSSWKISLDKLLQIKPENLDWEHSSLRDCLIVVLAKFKTPAHYREIYSEVAIHKHVSIGAIIGTLSRHCPSVFGHVGWSKWQLAGWAGEVIPPKQEPRVPTEFVVINDEIWNAVAAIEENDYVYKLLEKIRKPLSFDEICGKLADYLRVDVKGLRATGFLKADERLRRLDNGTWALEEWFDRQEEPVKVEDEEKTVEETITEKTPKSGCLWLVLIVLLIILYLCIIAGAVLTLLFLYGR